MTKLLKYVLFLFSPFPSCFFISFSFPFFFLFRFCPCSLSLYLFLSSDLLFRVFFFSSPSLLVFSPFSFRVYLIRFFSLPSSFSLISPPLPPPYHLVFFLLPLFRLLFFLLLFYLPPLTVFIFSSSSLYTRSASFSFPYSPSALVLLLLFFFPSFFSSLFSFCSSHSSIHSTWLLYHICYLFIWHKCFDVIFYHNHVFLMIDWILNHVNWLPLILKLYIFTPFLLTAYGVLSFW